MRRILSAATLALLTACSDPTGSATTDVRVETDKRTYVATDPVVFTITNATGSPVELAACDGVPTISVERREDRRWPSAATSICPANLLVTPVTMAPGATFSATLRIPGEIGTFRIVLPNLSRNTQEPRAISPTFEIRQPG